MPVSAVKAALTCVSASPREAAAKTTSPGAFRGAAGDGSAASTVALAARAQSNATISREKNTTHFAESANCGSQRLAMAPFLRYDDGVCLSSTAVASVAVSRDPGRGGLGTAICGTGSRTDRAHNAMRHRLAY